MGTELREETIRSQLCKITTEKKAVYVMYKCGVLYKPDEWDRISKTYFNGQTLEECDSKYTNLEDVQKAWKELLRIQHQTKMIQLYQLYFERAKEDTNAFKAFCDFSDKFFKDDINQLHALLDGVQIE